MNFNLISPSNNGSDYVVQFRENIEIKKSSKVYMNFCELTRQNNIILSEDGEIDIISKHVYPRFEQEGGEWINNEVNIRITVEKGNYTISEFIDYIELLISSDAGIIQDFKYYSLIFGDSSSTTNTIPIGFYLSNENITEKWKTVDLELDETNNLDFILNTNKIYTTNTASPEGGIYKSYGLANTHYYYYQYNDPDQTDYNWIRIKTTANLTDNICFGLYSTEYMNLGIVEPITNGTNLKTFVKTDTTYIQEQTIPMGFIIVEFQMIPAGQFEDEPLLKIWIAGQTNGINDGDIRNPITEMTRIHQSTLSSYFDFTTSMSVKFRTYNKSNTKSDFDSGVFYFQVWTDDINNTLIYDSIEDNIFFDKSFFEIPVSPSFTANDNECSIPFKVLLSSCAVDQGFTSVQYKEYKKEAPINGASVPLIIRKYRFEFSDNLKPYLGTVQTDYLYPNNSSSFPDNNDELYFYQTNISPDYLNDSYSVSIDELPLNSFKNKEDSNSGGYSQNIISNVPMPFLNSIPSYQTQKDLTIIKGLYEPNVPVINQMKNKDIRTNKFSIKIRNMKNDTIADELISSTINFTITE
jgi:hypothetical protein